MAGLASDFRVCKGSITIAVLPMPAKNPTRLQRLPNDLTTLKRFLARTARDGERRVCYEASGAGYVLHRALLVSHDAAHRALAIALAAMTGLAIALDLAVRHGAEIRGILRPWKYDPKALTGLPCTCI
jgi:hypothetical protein